VIRYHRDTGRPVTYEPGRPEYTGTDPILQIIGSPLRRRSGRLFPLESPEARGAAR
jgi:hypothetical protein